MCITTSLWMKQYKSKAIVATTNCISASNFLNRKHGAWFINKCQINLCHGGIRQKMACAGQEAMPQHAAHLPIDRVMMEAPASVTLESPCSRTIAFPCGSRWLLHAPLTLLAFSDALVPDERLRIVFDIVFLRQVCMYIRNILLTTLAY